MAASRPREVKPATTLTIASVMRHRRCGLTEALSVVDRLVADGVLRPVTNHSGDAIIRYVTDGRPSADVLAGLLEKPAKRRRRGK